ncbi:MAG: aldehyde ferredoxin oxidoreductase N-terminal domain-containing protein [Candidatus Muiribacteriota bacterium]
MNRILFIDIEKKEFTIASLNNRKKGLYLGYYLFNEYCEKDDVVITRGALSGILPGACHCYSVYFNKVISCVNYAFITGNLGATLLSQNFEGVVFRKALTSNHPYMINIYEENVAFEKVPEIKLYDYLQMKNLIDSMSNNRGDSYLFTGDFINSNIFSKLFATSNGILNGCGLGNVFNSKGIKIVKFNRGAYKEKVNFKKDYFSIIKMFNNKNPRGVLSRSCYGCPKHCFYYVNSKRKQSIKYVVYSEYHNLIKDGFYEKFAKDMEKTFYLFDIFSLDFMGLLPFLKGIAEKKSIYNEIGVENKENLDFKDFVMILKNLNIDNNNFYTLLRTDIGLFLKEYNINLKKSGNHFIPIMMTEKENKLANKDFYPPFLFDMVLEDTKGFLIKKAIYEFLGICPNNYEIYDEFWISKVGEKIDPRFSKLDGLNKFGEILLRYKYENEKKYTGIKRGVEEENANEKSD